MKVAVAIQRGNTLAMSLCNAMAQGVNAAGDKSVIIHDGDTNLKDYQALIIYGYVSSCQRTIQAAKNRGIPWVFLDMGYFSREKHYYKVSVNERHPEAYIMKENMPDDRWLVHKIALDPQKTSSGPKDYIVLAGLSGKAAWSYGYEAEQWEKNTIAAIKKVSNRDIYYRPKPTWDGFTNLPGTIMSRGTSLYSVLRGAHAVVVHHSNVAGDAIIAGIPAWAKYGAALPLCNMDLSVLEKPEDQIPLTPALKYQWASNVSYCQWNPTEMQSGRCWRHLRETGLVF